MQAQRPKSEEQRLQDLAEVLEAQRREGNIPSTTGTRPGEEVVRRGVDTWLWGVVYEDGTEGYITWGEKHEVVRPIGIETSNGKVVARAVRLGLHMQLWVRRRDGEVVFRLVPIPLQ